MKTAKEILCDALTRKQITVDEFKKTLARLGVDTYDCI